MKLVVFVLKEEDKLEKFVQRLDTHNIKNITILNANCVAHDHVGKNRNKNVKIFGSIRYIMNYFYDDSRLVLFPVEEEKIEEMEKLAQEILLKNEFMFMVLPLDRVEGSL